MTYTLSLFQRSEEHQFLFEAPSTTPVEELARQAAALHNTRLRLLALRLEGQELAEHGPVVGDEHQARTAKHTRGECFSR